MTEPVDVAGMIKPCEGLSVVEVAVGASELGLGLASGLPGMILGDLGASVVRVLGEAQPEIDEDVPWGHAWNRNKRVVVARDQDGIFGLLAEADVAFVYGPESMVEERGLGYHDVALANGSVVYARCRPSRTSAGTVDDFGLLVEASSGFCTQLPGHRPGPIFVDARSSASGTAFLLTASVLALLRRRQLTGRGGWSETSLYDGMLATLGCMIGRPERAAPHVERYWREGPTFPNFMYRCSDGKLIQVWFGGKGMYAKLLEVLGDEPSAEGYYTDQATGALNERAQRWRAVFSTEPREVWIERIRTVGVACEPVLATGDILAEPDLLDSGVAESWVSGGHEETLVRTPIALHPSTTAEASGACPDRPPGQRLLEGVRVLDLSAFVAGPLGAQVLADLGAEVIKVEPPEGEAMRAAAYAVAACQRGKRSIALDIGAEAARPVVERLIEWADVLLHNFRVGVSERLRIDEDSATKLNPHLVYCHASAFGPVGSRATYPGNDALMQAVTGFEQALGGTGNEPIGAKWIPIDMSGGWVAAIGMLAGLLGRARTGRGCRVSTSLLGAGMLLQSGSFRRDEACVRHPELDPKQTGYGPGYRIYEGSDGRWFALVVPDGGVWERLRSQPELASLPATFAPLRIGDRAGLARKAEDLLERIFASSPASHWVARLSDLGALVEPVAEMDRESFRQAVLDDPVNRQLGRVVSYQTDDWGGFEQIGRLLRCGPDADEGPTLHLPGVGEHTVEVLTELGIQADQVDALLASKVARQL